MCSGFGVKSFHCLLSDCANPGHTTFESLRRSDLSPIYEGQIVKCCPFVIVHHSSICILSMSQDFVLYKSVYVLKLHRIRRLRSSSG